MEVNSSEELCSVEIIEAKRALEHTELHAQVCRS